MPDEEPPGWKLLAEVVRLWLPIVVSVCAISLTVFQAMTTRRHARLSVQPRIEWGIETDTRTGVFEITLVNVGLGPAIVRSLAISIDGTPRPLTGLHVCEAVSQTLGRAPEAFDTTCAVLARDRVVRAGDRLSLYRSAPVPDHPVGPATAVLPDYRRFAVSGTYCSFYEECWQIPPP